MKLIIYSCFVSAMVSVAVTGQRYEPNWKSLDSRPLPPWYDDVKFGIFMHWGVFSVPGYGAEDGVGGVAWLWWYWKGSKVKNYVDFMSKNYRPDFTYADFAPQFTAEFYDPNEWAELFEASGARYVVLTAKHHEGFTNWPSKVSWNWNSMDVGPKRDLVGELASAIRSKTDIHFGLYHSLFEWFNPLYLMDKKNQFKTQYFVADKTMPELYELINAYKPELIWSDGDWEAPDTYWNSTSFLAWLYNESPVKDVVVVNDRWGKGDMCHHGGYLTCSDRFNPKKVQKKKFENAMTIDKHAWGFRRTATLSDILTIQELIQTLAETVSCGGNMLLNIGPTRDGRIVPIFEERLRQMGSWLKVNGEAIYGTKPWKYQQDDLVPNGLWYTSSKPPKENSVYAIVLDWPRGNSLALRNVSATAATTVSMLGYPQPFKWTSEGTRGIVVQIPPIPLNKMPCDWAWVFKFVNVF